MPNFNELSPNQEIAKLTGELVFKANRLLDTVEPINGQKLFAADIPVALINGWQNRPRISSWELSKEEVDNLLADLPPLTQQTIIYGIGTKFFDEPITAIDPAKLAIAASNPVLLDKDPTLINAEPILTSVTFYLNPVRDDIPKNLTWVYSIKLSGGTPILSTHQDYLLSNNFHHEITRQERPASIDDLTAFTFFLDYITQHLS
jgi:hypothetical protein